MKIVRFESVVSGGNEGEVSRKPAGRAPWAWKDAFDKFGFGDGDGQRETCTVVTVLEKAGYVVETSEFGLHNEVIDSIKKDGVEQIPDGTEVGYDDPRQYLPAAIVTLLDEKLPLEGEVRE